MRMINTALDSLDVLFFDEKFWILLEYHMFLKYFICGLEWKCFIQQFDWMNVMFGYHAYKYSTQNNSSRKVWYLGFQRRDDNPHRFTGSKLTELGTLVILINVKRNSKMWTFRWKILKLHNNTQTHPNIWKMYRTRRWKA